MSGPHDEGAGGEVIDADYAMDQVYALRVSSHLPHDDVVITMHFDRRPDLLEAIIGLGQHYRTTDDRITEPVVMADILSRGLPSLPEDLASLPFNHASASLAYSDGSVSLTVFNMYRLDEVKQGDGQSPKGDIG